MDGTTIEKTIRNRARPEISYQYRQCTGRNDKILDNQDLAFLLKVSFRTLQRYRASGKLPYFTISHKTYYRSADIRAFVQENADSTTYERFKKENQFDKQYEAKQGE